MPLQTTFTAAISVETWDAHFRWRTGVELRDRTIDATWQRVAGAAACVESEPAHWERRFAAAFREWRLLPDARLLQWAGTGGARRRLESPRATLNLGAFITHPAGAAARFDRQAFEDVAALAVRFLDDSLLACASPSATPALCVGVMGFADALALLDCAYGSAPAHDFATQVGTALSGACAHASLQLAHERGPWATGGPQSAAVASAASTGAWRHARTTAIHSQYLMARLANDASDALDPGTTSTAGGNYGGWNPPQTDPQEVQELLMQQIRLRGCLQRWTDVPIDYPLVYSGEALEADVITACRHAASRHHLPEPRFRRSEQVLAWPGQQPRPGLAANQALAPDSRSGQGAGR